MHNIIFYAILQKSALDKYNINKVNFDQIFAGNPPEFASSKKLLKTSLSPSASKGLPKPGSASKLNKSFKKGSPGKNGRQESMDKFVRKTDKAEGILELNLFFFVCRSNDIILHLYFMK